MKIALIGNGNMGKILQSIAKDQIQIVIENFEYQTLNDDLEIDIIIDFSNRENIKHVCNYALRNKCKVLIATTNLNDEDYFLLNKLSKEVAVMIDSNYSYGILLINKILKENIQYLNNYDIELLETHHKYKKDQPSGTMKKIEKIISLSNRKFHTTSLRVGTIRGEHSILLFGDEEIIEIKHTALSRKIYALGALEGAKWLMCKKNGLFTYEDCVFDK